MVLADKLVDCWNKPDNFTELEIQEYEWYVKEFCREARHQFWMNTFRGMMKLHQLDQHSVNFLRHYKNFKDQASA